MKYFILTLLLPVLALSAPVPVTGPSLRIEGNGTIGGSLTVGPSQALGATTALVANAHYTGAIDTRTVTLPAAASFFRSHIHFVGPAAAPATITWDNTAGHKVKQIGGTGYATSTTFAISTVEFDLESDGTDWILADSSGVTTDSNAIHGNTAAEISALTSKATPTVSDLLLIEDAAASNAKKKVTVDGVLAANDARVKTLTNTTLTGPILIHASGGLSDDTYSGRVFTSYNAGATLAQWDVVYMDSSSTWQKADANGSGTYPARGIAVSTGTASNPVTVLEDGVFRDDGGTAWTPGGTIYLSTTAGGLTQTAPSTTADKVQVIGFALSAHVVRLRISPDYGTAP